MNTADAVSVDFVQFLKDHARGKTAHDMSVELQAVVKAIRETGGKGSVTLKIHLMPANGDVDRIIVTDQITTITPKPARTASLFFSDDNGSMSRTDPQMTMEFAEKED